jgi:hypothetical protein
LLYGGAVDEPRVKIGGWEFRVPISTFLVGFGGWSPVFSGLPQTNSSIFLIVSTLYWIWALSYHHGVVFIRQWSFKKPQALPRVPRSYRILRSCIEGQDRESAGCWDDGRQLPLLSPNSVICANFVTIFNVALIIVHFLSLSGLSISRCIWPQCLGLHCHSPSSAFAIPIHKSRLGPLKQVK